MVASVFLRGFIARIAQTGRSCSSTIMGVICPGQTMKEIQRLIADNANGKGMMVRGAVLQGGSFARRPAAVAA